MDPTTRFAPEQKPDALQGEAPDGLDLASSLPLQPERFAARTGGYSPDPSNGPWPAVSAPIEGGSR